MSATGLILRAERGYSDNWKGIREVCIAGYHHLDRRAEFLFQVFAENDLEGKVDNCLYALHPGNVSFEQLNSWPMPHHPDEPALPLPFNPPEYRYSRSLLDMIYNKRFRKKGDKVIWKDELVEWDSWISETIPGGMKPEEVLIWPGNESPTQKNGNYIATEYPTDPEIDILPFTIFKLGPFTKKGPTLITLRLTIEGAAYYGLVASSPAFTIDGPETILLMTKMESSKLSNNSKDKETLEKELDKFDNYLNPICYDVILINDSGKVDQVKVIWGNGIIKAPHQPPEPLDKIAERYISAFPRFSLALKYSNKQIHKRIAADYNLRMVEAISQK